MLFSRSKNLVGLDIGDSAVKLAELKDLGRGRGYQIMALASEPLSNEAIVDGAIMDSGLVIETIQRLFRNSRVRSKQVATSLSGHSVIIKRVSLPVMNEQELAESIQWEAEQYIPFDVEDVAMDYQILEGSSLSGEGNMDVLLVAVKKDKITDYTSVISQAGLTPAVVEVDAFSLQNTFEANYEAEPQQTTALIDIGAAVTTITLLQGSNPAFWRDINIGGNQYTDAIQKELNLSAEASERVKRGDDVSGVQPDSVLPILAAVTEDVCNEIQKTIDFYKATSASDEPLDRMYLTGGTSQLVNLKEALAERFHTSVEYLNPFRKITSASRELSADALHRLAPGCAVAVGLALRKGGDR
jgi:type IV pilus assembly protein PilM